MFSTFAFLCAEHSIYLEESALLFLRHCNKIYLFLMKLIELFIEKLWSLFKECKGQT
jgi:hypothetical protein